jgi:glutathione synthase
MKIRYLLAGERQSTFKPNSDTGVVLAKEIMDRGFTLHYCDLTEADWKLPTREYLGRLPVRPVLGVRVGEKSPLDLGEKQFEDASQYPVILQRKDPPVDEIYHGHARHFSQLPPEIIQMNNPKWTPVLSEHLLPQEYPEFAVPTFILRSQEDFLKKAAEFKGKWVAKPKNLYSGIGIEFFDEKTPQNRLEEFWEKWKPEVIAQPFLKEIQSIGDLRILTMNTKVVGSVLRKPKPGHLLGNLHQGATPHAFTPTPHQLKAAEKISADLVPKGLYLLGLDFIGDYLTEINITCPTTVPQINAVMGIRGEKIIVDELEWVRRKSTGM